MKWNNKIPDLFPGLTFDEKSHTYWVNGVVYPSVSTILKRYYEEFDTETISKNYALKWGFEQKDVKNAWSGNALIATDRGTKVHLFGEDYAKWRYSFDGAPKKRPEISCQQTLGIIQFYNSLPDYVFPVNLELQMYNLEMGYTGTCDILLYNKRTGKYILADYKTNKELVDNNKPPILHLNAPGILQDNYGKYTCQLSLYRLLLKAVGIEVSHTCIIWLAKQESGHLFKIIWTEDLTEILKKQLVKIN